MKVRRFGGHKPNGSLCEVSATPPNWQTEDEGSEILKDGRLGAAV
jgi:hypothetical protein